MLHLPSHRPQQIISESIFYTRNDFQKKNPQRIKGIEWKIIGSMKQLLHWNRLLLLLQWHFSGTSGTSIILLKKNSIFTSFPVWITGEVGSYKSSWSELFLVKCKQPFYWSLLTEWGWKKIKNPLFWTLLLLVQTGFRVSVLRRLEKQLFTSN